MQILITKGGKSKRFDIPKDAHLELAVYKIFFPPDMPVRLGGVVFPNKDIDPWPPKENATLDF